MPNKPIDENSFEGSPGGVGSMNYGQSYGTFGSPDVSQNSSEFMNADKNKALNQSGNLSKDIPNSGSMSHDLETIYSKKQTPTPDEVVCGIKYELSRQIKKDKVRAKELVLGNLRKDPKYYSGLKMLNIDDESMMDNMSEKKQHPNDKPATTKITPNIAETKKIFEELAYAKDNKYVVNSHIVDVMKEMWDAKRQRSSWKNSQGK